jgi:hypothetical protein
MAEHGDANLTDLLATRADCPQARSVQSAHSENIKPSKRIP